MNRFFIYFIPCLYMLSCGKQDTKELTIENTSGYLSGFKLERCFEQNPQIKQDSLRPIIDDKVARLWGELNELQKVMKEEKLEPWNDFIGGTMGGPAWKSKCILQDIARLESTLYKNSRFNFQCKNHLQALFKTAFTTFKDNNNLRKIIIHESKLDQYGKKVIGRDVIISITPEKMSELCQFQSYDFFYKKYWHLYQISDNSDQFPFEISPQ